jgi:ribonuclease R
VGTRVRVQVSRVDLDSRRIDFRLVRDSEPGLPVTRARGERARAIGAVDDLLAVQDADRAGKAAARRKSGKKSVAAVAPAAKPTRTTRERKTPTRTRR